MRSKIKGNLNIQQKRFIDLFTNFAYRHNEWQVWRDFVATAACAISNVFDNTHYDQREKLYLDVMERYEPKEIEMFPKLLAIVVNALDENPHQDYLGTLFQLFELSNHWRGQFFTPYSVCEMIAKMQMQGLEERINNKGYVSVNDPACGAGALLIAFANAARANGINYQESVFFVAQDIDMTAAMMCYIQLSLIGCPGYVIVGDTLKHPPTVPLPPGYEVWHTPMYYSNPWQYQSLFGMLQ
jgi:type I restriction-modification system DNA methylase subunit